MCSGSVIIDHIQENGKTAAVTLVHELLILFARTISLVQGEIAARTVAPTVIAVELLDRHKLHRIHPQALNVIKMLHSSGQIPSRREIAKMHLINDQIIRILHFIIRDLPFILRAGSLKGRDQTCRAARV